MSRVAYFTDRVRRMAHDVPERVEVSFGREAARLWVDPARMEVLARLADAVASGEEVSIAWLPATAEIISVVPVEVTD